MTLAFHGDPAIRADVLARLRRHATAGTLSFGATRWDGTTGSTLGVAAESDASDDYAARFGYPLALAGLLDPIVACHQAGALETAIAWHEHVLPGSDMSGVPLRILTDLLARLGAHLSAPGQYDRVIALHRREEAGDPADRTDWARLRSDIEGLAAGAEGATGTALGACALACWPLARSRSVLVGLVHAWLTGLPLLPSIDFGEDDRRHAEAVLKALWDETQPQRDAAQSVHLPGLFRARHPDLSRRFEADLERTNAERATRAAQVQGIVLSQLAHATDIDALLLAKDRS